MKVNDVPGSTSKDAFVAHPDKLQTEIVVRDERNLIAYHYRVQDTPGEYTEPNYSVAQNACSLCSPESDGDHCSEMSSSL